MKSLYDRISFAYEGGLVERFHTRAGLRPCTDAAHSHGVAMLCVFLSEVVPSAQLLMEALSHDLAEQYSGDMPAPAKWALGSERSEALERAVRSEYDLLFPLTANERRTLELADALEGVLWCAHEVAMGNKKAARPAKKWLDKVFSYAPLSGREVEVLSTVEQIWRECNGEGPSFDIYTATSTASRR